jgi:hypothetical protein
MNVAELTRRPQDATVTRPRLRAEVHGATPIEATRMQRFRQRASEVLGGRSRVRNTTFTDETIGEKIQLDAGTKVDILAQHVDNPLRVRVAGTYTIQRKTDATVTDVFEGAITNQATLTLESRPLLRTRKMDKLTHLGFYVPEKVRVYVDSVRSEEEITSSIIQIPQKNNPEETASLTNVRL